MASTLPWMTASGVRSSWLTSASSRRRCVLVDLEARGHRVERADEVAQLARAAIDLRNTGRVVAGLDPTGRARRARPAAARPRGQAGSRTGSPTTGDEDDRHAPRGPGPRACPSATRPSSEPSSHSPMTPIETKTSVSRRMKHPNRLAIPRRRQGGPHGPLRPRGPHHGGPRHSGGGHGSSSGHQPGRSRGRGRPGRGRARQGARLGDAVADAVDGQDVARLARVRLELPAEVLDVRVDRPLVRLEGDAVDGVEQLRAGEDAARLAGHRGQQRELGRRQLDGRARDRRPAAAARRAAGRRTAIRSSDVAAAAPSLRRSTARTRATSSRGLNGLVM